MEPTTGKVTIGAFKNRRPKRREPMALNQDEVHKILDAAISNPKHHAIIGFMYYCGLRVDAVCHMTKAWIPAPHRLVYVPKEYSKVKRPYTAVIPTCFRVEVLNWLNNPIIMDRLFIIKRTSVWDLCQKYAEKAGIAKGCFPHALRASCAVWLIRNRDADVAAAQLGHKDASMTWRHYSPLDEQQKLDQIEDAEM